MSQLKLEAEAIQISIYCDIILNILQKHKNLSVNKILVFSYLIKKNRFISEDVYKGNNTQDIVYKCLSLLSGVYVEYCNNIQFILKAIHLLKSNNLILINGSTLYSNNLIVQENIFYKESIFMDKAIESSKKISEIQFMKEVTNNV